MKCIRFVFAILSKVTIATNYYCKYCFLELLLLLLFCCCFTFDFVLSLARVCCEKFSYKFFSPTNSILFISFWSLPLLLFLLFELLHDSLILKKKQMILHGIIVCTAKFWFPFYWRDDSFSHDLKWHTRIISQVN